MISKELIERIDANMAGVEKSSQANAIENEKGFRDPEARRLRAEASVEKVESMLEIWKEFYPEKMPYEDEASFAYLMHYDLQQMRETTGRRLEWRPEYEEMVSCFLPRQQRQELKDKGLNRQQIAEIAKDQIAKAAWLDKKDTEEMRQKLGADYFIGHYTGFSRETCEMLSQEEQTFHTRKKTGELESFKREFENEEPYCKEPLLAYIRSVNYRNSNYDYLVKAAKKDFITAYITEKAGKETEQVVEKPAQPVETKKEPASLKSAFARIKGFVKNITMPADEKARIAKEKKRIEGEKTRIIWLKADLAKGGGWYGKQSVKMLNESEYRIGFDSLGSVASSIDPVAKTITLNSAASFKTQMLSLVNAACVLKQEKDGAGKSPEIMAVRKAEALMMQKNVADHMDNSEMYQAFNQNNAAGPEMCQTFRNAVESEYWKHVGGDRTPQAAVLPRVYSACIDDYLDKVLPADKKPSPEQIAKVCRDFDGKSYYTPDNWYSREGRNEKTAGRSAQTEFKKPSSVYKESVAAAVIAKAKRGGR